MKDREIDNNILERKQFNYLVRSNKNQREQNEDSFHIFALNLSPLQKPLIIMAVADGMGGHVHGEYASREALRKLSLSLFEQLTVEPSINRLTEATAITPEDLGEALFQAVEQANAYVQKMVKNNNWGVAGSTIVVTAILDNTAIAVNLGDSPLFHYQASSDELTKVTEDHTVAAILLKADMITPEMARFHEGRNRLEFYVGSPQLPPIRPLYQVELRSGDLLLLCSDGVSGSLLLPEIQSILADSNHSLAEKAENLINKAQATGETDNQTLILWSHQG
jgi:protein phosphatase